jgi:hypothetical protein
MAEARYVAAVVFGNTYKFAGERLADQRRSFRCPVLWDLATNHANPVPGHISPSS